MKNVIFKELEIKNFKTHEDLAFSFEPNRLVTLVGDNGSGKTSIFSAIAWALYDECLDGNKGDDVVRIRSGKNTMVRISWSIDDNEYLVEAYRKDKKHKNSRYLIQNGKNISGNTNKETLATIEQLLMPKDIFMNCLLFSQYIKNHFADLAYSGQREIFDKMLDLLKYDIYYNKASKLKNMLEEEFSVIEKDLEINKSKMESFDKIINEETERLNEIKQKIKSELSEIQKNLEKEEALLEFGLKIELEKFSDFEKEYKTLLKDKVSTEEKIQTQRDKCKKEIENFQEASQMKLTSEMDRISKKFDDQINELNIKIKELKTDFEKIQTKKVEYESKINNEYHEEKNKLSERRIEVIDPLKEPINKLDEEERASTLKEKDLNESLEKNTEEYNKFNSYLKKDIPKCATCEQELVGKETLEKVKNKTNELHKNIEDIKFQLKKCSDREKEIKSERKELKEKLEKELDSLQKDEDLIKNKKIESEKKLKEKFEAEYDKLKNKEDELHKEIIKVEEEKEEKNKEFESDFKSKVVDKIDQIKEEHKSVAMEWIEKLKKIKEEESSLEEKKEEKDKLEKEVTEKSNLINNYKYSIEQLLKREKELQENESKIDNYKKEIETLKYNDADLFAHRKELEEEIKRIDFWKKGFSDSGIKSILLDETIPILNSKAIELCSIIPNLKVNFDSQTALKSGEYRNKFKIEVLQTKNLSGFTQLSSGEKRMVDVIIMLCLRNLLETIQETRINILLLDEVLDSLDPGNSAVVVELMKKLTEIYCVVLISHTLRNYIDADECFTLST